MNSMKTLGLTMLDSAKTVLIQDKHLVPVAFVFPEEGPTQIIPLEFRTTEEKRQVQNLMRLHLKEVKATAVAFIFESWMRVSKTEEIFDRPVSEYDDKQDCIFIEVKSINGDYWYATLPFDIIEGLVKFQTLVEPLGAVCSEWTDGLWEVGTVH